jgi:hypothetical protein
MLSLGSRYSLVPKHSGKTCGQHVEKISIASGQNYTVLHSVRSSNTNLWKTSQFIQSLYTFIIQLYTLAVGKFTPVINHLYTQYTGLTKTTTNTFTYITRRTA